MSQKNITGAVNFLIRTAGENPSALHNILTDDAAAAKLLIDDGFSTVELATILKQARYRIKNPNDFSFTADVLVFADDDTSDNPEQEFKSVAILNPKRREWLSRLIVYAMNNHKIVQISASDTLDKRLKSE